MIYLDISLQLSSCPSPRAHALEWSTASAFPFPPPFAADFQTQLQGTRIPALAIPSESWISGGGRHFHQLLGM